MTWSIYTVSVYYDVYLPGIPCLSLATIEQQYYDLIDFYMYSTSGLLQPGETGSLRSGGKSSFAKLTANHANPEALSVLRNTGTPIDAHSQGFPLELGSIVLS